MTPKGSNLHRILLTKVQMSIFNLSFSPDSYPISIMIVFFTPQETYYLLLVGKNKVAVPNGSFTSLGCGTLVICIVNFIAIAS